MRLPKPLLVPFVYSFGIAFVALVLTHASPLGALAVVYGLFAGLANAALDLIPAFKESEGELLRWRYLILSLIGAGGGLASAALLLHAQATEFADASLVPVVAVVVRMLARVAYSKTRKPTSAAR